MVNHLSSEFFKTFEFFFVNCFFRSGHRVEPSLSRRRNVGGRQELRRLIPFLQYNIDLHVLYVGFPV